MSSEENGTEAERIVRLEVTLQNLNSHFVDHDREEMEWRVAHDRTMKEFTNKMEATLATMQKTQDRWQYGWKGALMVLGALWVLIAGGFESLKIFFKHLFVS